MMLDKSSELILDNNLVHIKNEFDRNIPSLVLCSEPFHKTEFLYRLINSIENQIIFVDMDLLYTGYIESGMFPKKNNVIIFHPEKENWEEKLNVIISKVSKERILVIIDSLNGVYNMFDDLESTRFVNSCIMLLSSFANQTSSSVIVTGMTRKKDNVGWIISPGGKQIIRSEKSGIYFIKKNQNDLIFTVEETDRKAFKIESTNISS